MATDEPNAAGRYVTLQDYLRVIRRYGLIIVALTILGGGLGYLNARRQTPVYSSTASVNFTDPTQDLSLVGLPSNALQTPSQLAATASVSVTQPDLVSRVARRVKSKESEAVLARAISPSVSASNGSLQITASWSNPAFAARLANAAAQVVITRSNQATKTLFAHLGSEIQGRIAKLQGPANGRPGAKTRGAGTQLLFYESELPRVNTLEQFARSAQLATIAQAPSSPTSPKKTRSAALGAALGLLLGLVFAFVRDAVDRRLRNARDIQSSFRFPVLGSVRKEAMGQIAYATNGSKRPDQHLAIEAFKIVRRNLEFLAEESAPRSIVVTSGLPEEGKTTVAGSLAFAMAAAGKTTLLVDCDLRRSALSSRLGLRPTPGISDFLAGSATPEDVLQTVSFGEPPSPNGKAGPAKDAVKATQFRLVCIAAGSPTAGVTELLGSRRFQEFIGEVSQTYDVVILDSSPLLPVADTLEMVPHVDAVVLCARESHTTRAEAAAGSAALSRLPSRPTGLVVTGVKPRRDDPYGYSYYSYK
jgi:Mrp family chromosome partitioning ATPase